MIRDILILLLEKKFGAASFIQNESFDFIAKFPAAHAEVGELIIRDRNNEVIVEIGKITHAHFGYSKNDLTEKAKEDEISEKVVNFIVALFERKYVLWRSIDGNAGGFKHVDYVSKEPLSPFENNVEYFTWSGPL